jgi:hypothetical protein
MRRYINFKEAALDHILWITLWNGLWHVMDILHDDKSHTFALVVRLRKEGGDRMHAEAALTSTAGLTESNFVLY